MTINLVCILLTNLMFSPWKLSLPAPLSLGLPLQALSPACLSIWTTNTEATRSPAVLAARPAIQHTNWQPRYPDEEPHMYSAPTPVKSNGQVLANLREQMEPEEKARFDRQLEAEHQKLIAIDRGHLELQALPIGLPDPVPIRQYRKKKTHGLADARGLTGAEITALELKNREALARKRDVAPPEDSEEEDDGLLLFSTPPKPIG